MVGCRSKKARTEDDVPLSFWKDVPLDAQSIVVEDVLRYLSAQPNAKNWLSHIALPIIIDLFGAHGGLGRVLKTRFDTLCVSRTTDCSDEYYYYNWKLRQEQMAYTYDIRVSLEFIAAGGGQSITTLIIGDKMFRPG